MRLYHFTDLWFLQNGVTVLTEGLKPGWHVPARRTRAGTHRLSISFSPLLLIQLLLHFP
jgi:hypothetical protein